MEYTFKHTLTHEVAYGSLPQERRLALHTRLVEVLEGLSADHLAEQVERLAQHALAIAARLGDIGLTVTAQTYLGVVYRSLGTYQQAAECLQKNVACLHGGLAQECFGLPGLAAVLCRDHLVLARAECGDFAAGTVLIEEAVQLAEAADHPYSRVNAYWAMGFRCLRQGEIEAALPVLERAFRLAQEAHLHLYVPMAAAPLGVAYALAGRSANALALLEQASEQGRAMHLLIDQALRLVCLSEAYLLAGQPEAAWTQAQHALDFARAHQERGHAAYALRLLGEVAAQRHPPEVEPAASYYREALALAEELGMRPLQAHCHLGLGTLYARTSLPAPARIEITAALVLYRAMAMHFWIPQTEAALAALP